MFWIAGAIVIWGVAHSWLASLGVKAFVHRKFGEGVGRVYRIAYNILAVISFVPILLLVRSLPDELLYSVPSPWAYLMIAGQALGVILAVVTLLQTDAASFAGLRQIVEGDKPPRLVTGSFYRWMRHPLYLFGLIVLWLTPWMSFNMLIAYVSLTVYLLVGAAFEERKLVREFGTAYEEYKSHTPMILPLPTGQKHDA